MSPAFVRSFTTRRPHDVRKEGSIKRAHKRCMVHGGKRIFSSSRLERLAVMSSSPHAFVAQPLLLSGGHQTGTKAFRTRHDRQNRSFPPLEFCHKTKPIHAANCRPDRSAVGSETLATIRSRRLRRCGEMAASRRLTSLSRRQMRMRLSRLAIRFSISRICSMRSVSTSKAKTGGAETSCSTSARLRDPAVAL
jgi:hypothetical protein